MVILKGVPFLPFLPAGKRIGTAQLAGEKKEHLFQKMKFSKVIIFLFPCIIDLSQYK